ncbi:carbamoyltransferase HypF [Rhizobium sp. SEMIA 4085]|uniref:Carbamoyltransferase HypF n=1 Tax=Rhizobium gallicum bv. gallicum R602sp TaxID=1041138 RepID=A0A0B4XAG2_9HYPH|nr:MULTISPECIES: carbamoyltransferase HypF [Rhizobium]AJD43608.1 hydrogenase maturation factor carbamoyltransferase protein HypF [Rhizobium gallicum bv. gallicum R602sp]NNH28761.1 carbamoyltransferase HypF [Rhizobium sp. SEMIA 4085]TDW34104.1 hydrogenase maturation carbamoyltransferase HypF [Rhizobium azibense]
MARALASSVDDPVQRLRLRVRGSVQGVGFRPFVFRLARTMRLTGFVLNDSAGVLIEVEGTCASRFPEAVRMQAPPLARIDSVDVLEMDAAGGELFEILESVGGQAATRIGADAATCAECRRELTDPQSRFFGYPFVNCTHCGPRFTITGALPYDRRQTSMAAFPMCAACRADYADPESQRFHAEPVACPDCGPELSHPVGEIAARLLKGEIVALKGIGGFHLFCDAHNDAAIDLLRLRKARDQKPFAIMVRDIEAARLVANLTAVEEGLLMSSARPIVLVEGLDGLSNLIAPGLTRIGLMLAYAPLHHLLFDALAQRLRDGPAALVATSANPGGEPLVASNDDAVRRLAGIADLIVTHNRDIAVRADDSVMQVIDGAPSFLRRARGFVPEPVDLGEDGPCVIATGADLKNTVCITRGREAFLSQHIGGLDNAEAIRFQQETVAHLCSILDIRPDYATCDLHPDFRSVRMAESLGLPLVAIQHHLAHIAAVVAEHHVTEPVLGLALDGHGYGADGGSWGGEMLMVDGHRWQRLGSLSPLPLPGGDRAAREPWRMGVAALRAAGRIDLAPKLWPGHPGVAHLEAMFARGMQPARTSSLGRLFDAAAAVSGLCLVQSYEGQAAIEFEALAESPHCLPEGYSIVDGMLDFRPLIVHLAERQLCGVSASNLFHGTLIAGLVDWAACGASQAGTSKIMLGGGCIVNRILAEGLANALRNLGLEPLLPRMIPANDGGIALGQAAFARQVIKNDRGHVEENPKCA